MDDLIKRQGALDAIKLTSSPYLPELNGTYPAQVKALKELPSVDAVEVVRCKDCKYASPNGKYGCKSYHYRLYECHEMGADDYCSRGERKTDETD